MIIWRVIMHDQDGTGYARDSGRISTPHNNYGTGQLYMVAKYEEYLQDYTAIEERIDIASKATATFAVIQMKINRQTSVLFCRVQRTRSNATTDQEYRLGSSLQRN